MRATFCEEFGWLPSEVDDLEWDIIESIARRGKPATGIKVRNMEDVQLTRRHWRKMIKGFGG